MAELTANIHWTNPIKWENVPTSEHKDYGGLYQITGKIKPNGRKIYLIYIGKAFSQTFEERLNDPKKLFLPKYKELKVRFGYITIVERKKEYSHQYEDVESGAIFELRNEIIENKMKTYSYNPTHLYTIHSSGKRGFIPSIITMKNH